MPEGNLLANEASPYLLQHKDNPVHWRPWGPAAFAEAERTGKPVLLSIGYAACHWCHVMAHESFEDPATADLMNRLFVNIKVDREERPDVDQIYMAALQALDEQGGWPLTMFLTPKGEPVWGGTYFPRESRYGRPSFVSVLTEVARLFREEPEKIATNRRYLMERLGARRQASALPLGTGLLDEAAGRLLAIMDTAAGGTVGAPKFPQASLLAFFSRAGLRTRDRRYTDIVRLTLTAMATGGIYDHIGGGLCRYAVDARWLVPHFEKMLYDNAQFVERLTFAWLIDRNPLFRTRVEETVAWLLRELRVEQAFAASLDADSEGGEGRYYVWRYDEVQSVLGPEAEEFARAYDITPGGNWEGYSIPNRLHVAGFDPDEDQRLAPLRRRLLDARERRPRPARDDKVLADWNGLAIAALSLAGWAFERPDWIDAARTAYDFVGAAMTRDGRVGHSWREGRLLFPGFASDHAALAKAALALHHATQRRSYLADAETLVGVLCEYYGNPEPGGYFMTASDADPLITRPTSLHDEAVPGATSVAVDVLIRLWHLTGNTAHRAEADRLLEANSGAIGQNLFAAAGLLAALEFRLNATEIVLVLPPEFADAGGLIDSLRSAWRENHILSIVAGEDRLPASHPAHGKTAVAGKPTAYVCRDMTCSLPVTEPEALLALLDRGA